MSKRIVIALGGNALGNTPYEQLALVTETAKPIVDLIAQGNEVIIAPHSGKGMSDLMALASAAVAIPRLIMPTCGPLPWAMMTSLPCAIRSTMGFAVSVTRASCS